MASDRVRFQRPSMPSAIEIERYFDQSRAVAWYSNGGPCCEALIERVAERVGPQARVTAVSSGTSAIAVALQAVGLSGDGKDEVLMPSFTFVAAANAAVVLGLKPVFVDIDPHSWQMSPGALDKALERRSDHVVAIIACSAFGTPPPASTRLAWERAARAADVPLIIDSAAGFGAVAEDGLALGLQGDVEVFSLHATKPLAVGEGGLVVSSNSETVDCCARLSNFGFDHRRSVGGPPGLNSKLSEIHSAVGLAALDGFDCALERRRVVAQRIARPLMELGLEVQDQAGLGTWQFVPVTVPNGVSADALASAVAERIETRRYYTPLHQMSHLARFAGEGSLATTEAIYDRILCLPMWPDMDDRTADEIVTIVSAELNTLMRSEPSPSRT